MRKRIGSTVYDVNLYFNPEAKEKIQDKIIRLVKNDLNTYPSDGKMDTSPTSRLPEVRKAS
ncbi:MAG: transposon-encoded TnpW family protein [Oscillospiraceae bacterium]|nr:transposon-encoded TnpW family protein [Oscillospiraceae bacterium]